MDAAQLGRWMRFAAKGGIGRATALVDYVAERPQDLMFLKVRPLLFSSLFYYAQRADWDLNGQGDEIVVLMKLEDEHVYLVSFPSMLSRGRRARKSAVVCSTCVPIARSRTSVDFSPGFKFGSSILCARS